MRTRLTALLAAMMLAVLWASPQSVEYLCSMSGERRATCCCGPDGDHAEESGPKVERRTCCELERTPANVPPAVAQNPDHEDPIATALGFGQAYEHRAACTAPEFVPMLARGPPRAVGPPTYLRDCRFLI